MSRAHDPLLQPYQLKHLTLKNRIMTASHEPAYSEDGLPKDRYRLYHVERARGGVALTMTAGSAIVSPDSPDDGSPPALGVLGVGALATALVEALARAAPSRVFHLSPRGEAAAARLAGRVRAVRHGSNQEVVEASGMLVIGVRPDQLASLASEIKPSSAHHLLTLSAGTPLIELERLFAPARVTRVMTGLAVAGGASAISVFPPSDEVRSLLEPASASVVGFDDERQFDASILAVCANAWWLEQLAVMTRWLVESTGMRPEQASALLTANLTDVAVMMRLYPEATPDELARAIGTPGTFTALGLDRLEQTGAHRAWTDALALVLQRLHGAGV